MKEKTLLTVESHIKAEREVDSPSITVHLAAHFWAQSHLHPCIYFSLNKFYPHQNTARAVKSNFPK